MEMNKSQLVPFSFGDHLVRIFIDESGDPWWVAKDVCKILEIQNSRDALSALDDDEKITVGISDSNPRFGIPHEMNLISESGLYALVFRSRKPEARAFSKWVRSEVLPQIRKTGRYESRKAVGGTPLPDSIIEISLNLKPAMRQRLWRDALDTARLDGGGIELACQCFESLCGMMSAKRVFPDTEAMIIRFMDERLVKATGYSTPFAKIEKAFREWWQEFGYGSAPRQKTLANYLLTRFQSYKCSVMMYRDCLISEGA